MGHFLLQPEVAGGRGKRTIVEQRAGHPSYVSEIHCELSGWLGDDLVECFPCFLVTEALSAALAKERLTGFELADAEVTSSAGYDDARPGHTLPKFRWLKVNGTSQNADFWMENDQSLAVSERAWQFLNNFQLQHCKVRRERS